MADGDPEDVRVQQALMDRLTEMKNESTSIAHKFAELDQEKHEHSLVLDTLGGLDDDRKCFRMIGSVLTERTVGEVKPAIKDNMDNLEIACKGLTAKLQEKEKEMMDFQAKHNIRFQKNPPAKPRA